MPVMLCVCVAFMAGAFRVGWCHLLYERTPPFSTPDGINQVSAAVSTHSAQPISAMQRAAGDQPAEAERERGEHTAQHDQRQDGEDDGAPAGATAEPADHRGGHRADHQRDRQRPLRVGQRHPVGLRDRRHERGAQAADHRHDGADEDQHRDQGAARLGAHSPAGGAKAASASTVGTV
jgi:hypothetical protein